MAQIGKWVKETYEEPPVLAPRIVKPEEQPVEAPAWLDPNKVAVPVRRDTNTVRVERVRAWIEGR